jgi:peptidyl-prolyl cis-trans isomerase C
MTQMHRIAAVVVLLWGSGLPTFAQQPPASRPLSPVVTPSSPSTSGVAATVNGQPISENAVQRGLKRVAADQHAQARPAILDFLIDNVLLDQYLAQHGMTVPKKEVEDRIQQVRDEAKKDNKTFEQLLRDLMSTEQEFRMHVEAQIRWDKYVDQQATDEALKKLFTAEHEMFDGTMVRARHILLSPPPDDAQAAEKAKAELLGYKKEIEERVKQQGAKLPADADALARENARKKLMDDAFSEYASKHSVCPSKEQGGDVDWFPRGGHMVETFSKAAFALKPYDTMDIVKTPFGYHLILATDRRPGLETKFEDVKAEVKDLFCARLRESICAQMRPSAKISLSVPAKP